MNKTAKSGHRNKRRGKPAAPSQRKAQAPVPKNKPGTGSSGALAPAADARRRDHNETKRRLWERKQAELEARWIAAQARQTQEVTARRRNAKILAAGAGIAVMIMLLCALALHYARYIRIPGLPWQDGS